RVVVKESGNMRWLSLPGTKKHQTFREGVLDEPHILECSVEKATITECFIGIDKPDHSHRVPSCYDLVVETGSYPLIANREKTIFHSLESGIPFRYRQIMLVQEIALRLYPYRHVLVRLPISLFLDGIIVEENIRVVAKHLPQFPGRPVVEFPLLSFAVGVKGGVKPAFRVHHLSLEPREGLSNYPFELRLMRQSICFRIKREQLCIVVEHLFEMGYKPVLIDRVTRKTSPQLIVDSAHGDLLQREHGVLQHGLPMRQMVIPQHPSP